MVVVVVVVVVVVLVVGVTNWVIGDVYGIIDIAHWSGLLRHDCICLP